MSRPVRITALVAAVALGTLALSRFWYAHPDWFPRALWGWLDSGSADTSQNLEFLAVVVTALAVVSTAAYAGVRTWRWLGSGRRKHA